MTPLFKKLNYKAHPEILVLGNPASFDEALTAMREITQVQTSLVKTRELVFVLAFVSTEAAVADIMPGIAERLAGDGVLWFAYPKQSSRKYKSEISRDRGWQLLGQFGFEPVRAVSIDDDWSALRFRRVEFIKKMTRNAAMTMTEAGRIKAGKK